MLCDNIKNLRKEKGMSQEELAVRLNVVRQTVSKWEQNLSVPDSDMLVKLAEVFGVSVGTLLDEEPAAQEIQQNKCTECKKKSKKRKIMTAVAVIFLVAAFLIFFNIILAYFIYPFWQQANSIAIIGGADGPTAIFVADVSNDIFSRVMQIAAACVLAVIAVVIIKKTRK